MARRAVDLASTGIVSTPHRRFVHGACARNPLAPDAVGEVAAALIENGHTRPDVLFVFVTRPFKGILEDIGPALRTLLSPDVLIGCAAEQIIDPDGWLLDQPAISILAVNTGEASAVRIEPGEHTEPPPGRQRILLADAFSVENRSHAQLSGTFPPAPGGPATQALLLDGNVFTDGGVAVDFTAECGVTQPLHVGELPLVDYIAAKGMLVFGDINTSYWRTAIEADEELRPTVEYGPFQSGCVGRPPIGSGLTVFGDENRSIARTD